MNHRLASAYDQFNMVRKRATMVKEPDGSEEHFNLRSNESNQSLDTNNSR
jgi:hypothetical protein